MGLIKKALRNVGKCMLPEHFKNNCVQEETLLILQGKQLALLNSMNKEYPKRLSDFEFRIFSQWGEDGIIEWLVSQLSPLPQIFIEFGVENYSEANTRFLLINRNWRGLIIDGSEDSIAQVKRSGLYWRHDLTVCANFITRENINNLFKSNGFSGEIGLMSVDMDGNDYWVWEAIDSVNPAIVICEYCAHFGDIYPISIPYQENFTRFGAHYSGQYFGASIKALISLAKRKGYSFIGTNASGINAFFVRNDFVGRLSEKILEPASYPMRASDTRNEEGTLTFIHGPQKAHLIKDMPVVNVETGKEKALGEFGNLYSEEWLNLLQGGQI